MWSEEFSESIKRIAKLQTDMVKMLSERVTKPLEEMQKKLVESFRPLYEMAIPTAFENLGKTFKVFADGVLLFRLQTLGMFEWCNIDEWIDIANESDNKENLSLSDNVILKLEENDNFTAIDVDKYVGKYFTQEIIKRIEEATLPFLDEHDVQKLKRAMIDFRARRYFDSANLLAGLIDSQSIKQELYDIKNGKYQDRFVNDERKPNVSQCWKSFYHVFANNFSIYFDGEEFNPNGKQEIKEESFEKFIDRIKGKLRNDDETIVSIIALSICLFNFFSDSDWTYYPEYIPSVLNRHWLMHGMYDIEDITRHDCIKLLLMLNQISKIYSKLRNGEL